MKSFIIFLLTICCFNVFSQSKEYKAKKKAKISVPSPFEAIISGDKMDEIVYQDEYVVAFVPIRKQAPVHLLIVPKKRVYSLNEIQPADEAMLAHLLLAAKKLAKDNGIDQTGYRVSMNTNEDAGQSVFHLHLHLLGGMPLGPIVYQTYKEK
uniref:HIT domain-containing protein n=1 Tax=Roseivirga sp. TaxID=1964215 RepID=UPI004047AC2E